MELLLAQEDNPDALQEYQTMLERVWDKENEGHIPLHINWHLYNHLMNTNTCMFFTARNLRDDLCGGVFYIVLPHPHHMTHVIAECDMINVHHTMRGLGVAKRLMEYAEPILVARGVNEIVHRWKHTTKRECFFPKIGYTAIETVYTKKVT